jgi:plasmid replication initiation protein
MNQPDFFVCDIFDAAPKGDIASMEHPIFSVATKPDLVKRRYENGKLWVEVRPSGEGLATVHDRDILIYCISQIMAALNEGREVSQTLRFKAYDLLSATNRGSDGRGYEQLRAALVRLRGTTIETNITTNDLEVLEGFGLIDSYKIVRETRDGRMQDLEVRLSDWVFNAIRAKEVLTLNRQYFRLRKPLERRLYELARKHCGAQPQWRIRLDTLQNKCGSQSSVREFRRLVKTIVDQDAKYHHMPDYVIRLDDEDMVTFINRGTVPVRAAISDKDTVGSRLRPLDPDCFQAARFMAPGYDVYFLEREFRDWLKTPPKNLEQAFLGFCKSYAARRKKNEQ